MQERKIHPVKSRTVLQLPLGAYVKRLTFILMTSFCLTWGQFAAAQETDIAGRLSVELNAAQTLDGACTLSFLITNGFETPIEQVVFEAVLFDANGQVDRLTLFDFGALPPARPRVRQFVLPQVECEGLSRILFNGANTCRGVDPALCETGLLPSSRTGIEVLG